jgi:hypothetical protein
VITLFASSSNKTFRCSPKQQQLANEPSRFSVAAFCFIRNASPFLEIALVRVRLDHFASVIINANHGKM